MSGKRYHYIFACNFFKTPAATDRQKKLHLFFWMWCITLVLMVMIIILTCLIYTVSQKKKTIHY